jgi:uncharacterized membrane-anchored protein
MLRLISVATALLLASAALADVAPPPAPAPGQPAESAPPTPEELQKFLEDMKKQQEEFTKAIGYKDGPLTGDMGLAQLQVPAGFVFTDGNGAKKWGELTTNPVSGKEIGLVGPKDNSWLVLFEFDDVGYVKDDEKDDLDADALLDDIKEGTAAFNEERAKAGVAPMNIVGWEQKPVYNEAAHALEWCVRAESAGEPSLNFNTRLLGRRGVVSVTLMFGGETKLADVLPPFRELLKGFSFKQGETYAEFREGDKLAEYGLAALVAGGGVALAAKSGLLAKLAKPLIVGVVAIGTAISSFFKKLFGKKQQ